MGDVAAHAAAHNAVPCRQVDRIELCFDNFCNVIEDSSLLESKGNAVDSVLHHVVAHIGELDHCVLGLLLVNATMGLHLLRVRLSFPLLCFVHTLVSLLVLRHTHFVLIFF